MRILGAALVPLILLVPAATQAQGQKSQKKKTEYTKGPVGKAPAPCGAKILPLVEGNKWTYVFVESGVPLRDDLTKLTPAQPGEVVITVKSVETKGPDTVITLEEKTKTDIKTPKGPVSDERTISSTITCNAKKFEISPDSFFFAGEPGGSFGMAFDKFERPKDTTLKLVNGTIGDAEWREDIVAHFTRTAFSGANAKLEGGKLELERKFTPQNPESVNTKAGLYVGAEKLALTITGRITFDNPQSDIKLQELPIGWVNQFWMVPNVGVVQVLNAFSHKYMLSEAQLK